MAYNNSLLYLFNGSNTANAPTGGVVAQLSKAASSTGNPSGFKPTTLTGVGFSSNSIDPYVCTVPLIIKSATLKNSRMAVGSYVAITPCTMRFDVYTHNYNSRTSVGTFYFITNSAGNFNDVSADGYATYTVGNLNIAIPANTPFGFEFTPDGSNASVINNARQIWLTLFAQESTK